MSSVKRVETFDGWVTWLEHSADNDASWDFNELVKCTEIELALSLGDTSKKSQIYVWVLEMHDYIDLYEIERKYWSTDSPNHWAKFAMDCIQREIKA